MDQIREVEREAINVPMNLKRACRQPGCRNTTHNKRGYCDDHIGAGDRAYRASRPDTAEQKFYASAQWRKVRKLKLQQDPLCEICERQHVVKAATIVHHKQEIKQGGDPFAWDNIESVCASCHMRLHKR